MKKEYIAPEFDLFRITLTENIMVVSDPNNVDSQIPIGSGGEAPNVGDDF